MYKLLLLVLISIFLSCSSAEQNSNANQVEGNSPEASLFWENIEALCGKAYQGEVIKAPADNDFMDKELIMHVKFCSDSLIHIPFNVGDNRSRTWVFRYIDGRIELKHDHRHPDGTDEDITMYGGTTSSSGLPHIQVFPADQETADMLPEASPNVWWITINDSVFTYNLRRFGTEREFTVAFDLTNPVEIPQPSWGWE